MVRFCEHLNTIRLDEEGKLIVSQMASLCTTTEVKIKPEHMEGAEHSNVEPITPEVISRMEKPMVETTSCQSKKTT